MIIVIKAVACGELLIDFNSVAKDEMGYPTIEAHPGGATINCLATLRKFDAEAAFIGKVGDDAFGKLLLGTLSERGIDTSNVVSTPDAFTTLAFVTLDETGDREFSFARKPGADLQMSFDETDLSVFEGADVFHFGTVSMTAEPSRTSTKKFVEYARSKGILIGYDPNLRESLWKSLEDAKEQIRWGLGKADVVKISDNEVEFLYGLGPGAGMNRILEDYPNIRLIYVTCGAEGCYFGSRGVSGFTPSMKGLKVVDTCGAGDIFGGSAMYRLLSSGKAIEELTEEDLTGITRFAATAAGLSTLKHGGISSIPEFEDVLAHM